MAATAQQPAFEVGSIRLSHDLGPLPVTSRIDPDGIDFYNVTPRMCIQRAYGVKPDQLIGPDWIDTERYPIVAKAGGEVSEDRILLMLQLLLAERFKLAIHHQSQERAVYALVIAKNGPKLKEDVSAGATQIGGDGPARPCSTRSRWGNSRKNPGSDRGPARD
jgi:uncharacterized protein (TIGR03435 family)